jgi:hypothetical protein
VAAVNAQGAHSGQVRGRLKNVLDLVRAAEIYRGNSAASRGPIEELTWQLLQALFVIGLQFEGDAAPARTNLVARLAAFTGDASRAEDLRLRLVSIADASEIRAGAYTRPMLRRNLRSFGQLGEAPDFIHARPQMDLLESALRARTSGSLKLPGADEDFNIDRSVLVEELVRLATNSPSANVIIVRGEPDVGKSAVALRAMESIRSSGASRSWRASATCPPRQ